MMATLFRVGSWKSVIPGVGVLLITRKHKRSCGPRTVQLSRSEEMLVNVKERVSGSEERAVNVPEGGVLDSVGGAHVKVPSFGVNH